MTIKQLLVSILVSAFVGRALAQEWMQFRGPNGSGVSNSTNLPVEFGPEKNLLWKTPLPAVHSSPVFGNERIFLTGFEDNKLDRLEGAIDKYFASPVAADGKVYLVSEAGNVSVVKAAGEWTVLKVNKLDKFCYATPAIIDNKLYVRTQSALYCFARALGP